MNESPACRSCGSISIDDLGPCAPFDSLESDATGQLMPVGRLLRCRKCGLGQRQPCLLGDELAAIYRDTPADTLEYPPEQNVAWQKVAGHLRRVHADNANISVLDIGCHTGSFLASLPDAWKRYGIEGAIAPASVATTRHRVAIVAESLETAPMDWHGRFDVVTLFDVLEHLPDPSDALLRASKLMKPNGILVASTGDMDAWTWKWSRGGHWYLQAPQHISICSRRFFDFVARRHNLCLQTMSRIAHSTGTQRERVRQTVETIHWGMRQKGTWWRAPRRLLEAFPAIGQMSHTDSIPWSMKLRDHTIAVFTRAT